MGKLEATCAIALDRIEVPLKIANVTELKLTVRTPNLDFGIAGLPGLELHDVSFNMLSNLQSIFHCAAELLSAKWARSWETKSIRAHISSF
jgi:hypothetical protein